MHVETASAKSQHAPLVIGVIGGIASGKSEVTRYLLSRNTPTHPVVVIDADKIGHHVLLEPDVQRELCSRFGDSILDDSGRQIDRKRLAALVFGNDANAAANRHFLESISHPRIRRQIQSQIEDASLRNLPPHDSSPQRATNAFRIQIILDAPLLLEAKWADLCQRIVFVEASDAVRLQRAIHRGWTAKQFYDREAAQGSLAMKKEAATDIIANDGDLASLHQAIDRFISRLNEDDLNTPSPNSGT